MAVERVTANSRNKHHDGPKAEQAGLEEWLSSGWFAFAAFGIEREIDHHDGVFSPRYRSEQDHADERDDIEFCAANNQREDGADTGRRQRGKNCDGVNVAFVQDAQDDIDRDDGGENEQWFIGERFNKSFGGSRKSGITLGGAESVCNSF